jgi:transcriptional regulator with XRE-family HTH domain
MRMPPVKTRHPIDLLVGQRIKELRERYGLQSKELADKAGLNRSALSKIENGNQQITMRELAAIAEVLGISLAELLEDTDPLAPSITHVRVWRESKRFSEKLMASLLAFMSTIEEKEGQIKRKACIE